MAHQISKQEIEKELKEILSFGVIGYPSDYLCWLKMSFVQKFDDFQFDISEAGVKELLDSLVSSGDAKPGEFDKKEYTVQDQSDIARQSFGEENYVILGGHEYSPIQYLRSRLEYFLKRKEATEADIMDISIATIEAIENAVKYGDGKEILINYSVASERLFSITITNRIKEFELQTEIERGKYSSNITLMRGVMVMQKLFDNLDLSILDDTKQAKLFAQKKLS
ncbi:MAG: ATP-binding protein [Spirochaetota bacterium]